MGWLHTTRDYSLDRALSNARKEREAAAKAAAKELAVRDSYERAVQDIRSGFIPNGFCPLAHGSTVCPRTLLGLHKEVEHGGFASAAEANGEAEILALLASGPSLARLTAKDFTARNPRKREFAQKVVAMLADTLKKHGKEAMLEEIAEMEHSISLP